MSNRRTAPVPAVEIEDHHLLGQTATTSLAEGRMVDGAIVETWIENTIRIEHVLDLNGNLWAHGPVVATTSATPASHLGRTGQSYIGRTAA